MRLEIENIKQLVNDGVLELKLKEASHANQGLGLWCVTVPGPDVYLYQDAWLHLDVAMHYPDGWRGWFKSEQEARGHVAILAKQLRRHGIEVTCKS